MKQARYFALQKVPGRVEGKESVAKSSTSSSLFCCGVVRLALALASVLGRVGESRALGDFRGRAAGFLSPLAGKKLAPWQMTALSSIWCKSITRSSGVSH